MAEFAASVASQAPRFVVLSAPPGYRKGAFLRAYEPHVGVLITCDFTAEAPTPDFARIVFDALVSGDRRRAGSSAADRLAQRAEAAAANARETLRRQWTVCEGSQLFVLRDPSGKLATPAGLDLLSELVATLPSPRLLALSTRLPLPPALQQIFGTETVRTIGPSDLALTRSATTDLAVDAGLSAEVGEAVYELARGWPLVSELLVVLLQRGDGVRDLVEAAQTLAGSSLLAFCAHRIIARSEEMLRNALVVAAIMRGAKHAQLMRILGDGCDDLVFARLSKLPFVVASDDKAIVHPEVAAILRDRFAPVVKTLYERTLSALTGEGAYVEAAQVALDRGDASRAAEIIDAAPPYTAAPVPLAEYERIIERLDRGLLTRYPNLWIATIPYRSFAVDRATFVREAETVYYCLPPVSSPDQRAAALMLLASAYYNSGRGDEAERLIGDALKGFALSAKSARAALLHFSASMLGMEGRFTAARSVAAEAARISRDGFGENQTLHYIDAHDAAYRGQNDRVVVIVDELLRRSEDLPLHRANTAANGVLFTWVSGDDDSFLRYLGALEDALTPGLERGFRPIVDAARGHPVGPPDGYLWSIGNAQAQLYRLGSATSAAEALDAARAAVRCADERGESYTQILAHAALYVLDPEARPHETVRLERLVAPIESNEMRSAVRCLLDGKPAGILEQFVRRRVLREHFSRAEPRLEVQLLGGRVVRDGVPVRLSDKEFELLAILGAAHGPLSRDRIGEALWDHLDPEEWPNNLKVTLSRIRGKLAMRDAIVLADGRYRLSPAIDVDLRRAESALRAAAEGKLEEAARASLSGMIATLVSGGIERYSRLPWAQPLIARIEDLACRIGVLLANDAFTTERLDDALRFAGIVIRIDPFNEGAFELTLRALTRRGDADAARRELRRYATALADELGAAPTERLVAIVRGAE